MHVIPADRTTFAFRPDAEPVLRIQPGETVQFETSPNPVERLFAAGDKWLDVLDINAINAVTGPVYIEGVEPGDAVSVEILDVQPGEWGWNAAIPGFGLLGNAMPEPMLRRIPIRDGRVQLTDTLSVPVRPMIGCLGLAPATGESSTLGPAFPWGGNYDLRQNEPGTTILFPAQIPGGLFSLGDLHAAMGMAEATYVSIEGPGKATVRLGVRKGLHLETPRLETADRVYTIGLDAGANLDISGNFDRARRQATRLMFDYLTKERGLSSVDAYIVVSAVVDLDLGGPAAAVVLASLPLSVLD